MKKNIFIICAMSVVALASCSKEPVCPTSVDSVESFRIPVTVSVSSASTKAYYGDKDGEVYPVIW